MVAAAILLPSAGWGVALAVAAPVTVVEAVLEARRQPHSAAEHRFFLELLPT